MKLPGIVTVLTVITGIPFTEWAWSEAPADRYGVVTVDGQSEFRADADPVAEKVLTGYADVYVKASDTDPRKDVETALKMIGVWFRLESIQFEPESGLLHLEWRWVDSMRKAEKQMYITPVFVKMFDENINMSELIEAARNGANIIGVLYDEYAQIYSNLIVFNENSPDRVFMFEFYQIDSETGQITINSISLSTSGTFSGGETVVRTGCVAEFLPNTFSYANIEDAIKYGSEVVLIEKETDPMPGGASTVVGTRRKRLTWYGEENGFYYATFDNEVGFSSDSYEGIMMEY